nr:urotensin-2 receptor-like [Anolis sagrei ordinatus]
MHADPGHDTDMMEPSQHDNQSDLMNGSTTAEVLINTNEVLVTTFLGGILATMCLIGMVGNIYTLVVVSLSRRLNGSMYVYIVNLAVADLLYLSTIPFVICTYVMKDWYFGEVGCRVLFGLDLLTMHASIFTLTVMSTERYLAVVKPLETLRRQKVYRRAIAGSVWAASFLLTLPTMILIDLRVSSRGGVTKRMCHPMWRLESYKVYLTLLFNTSILAPGLIICYLYVQLARTYWRSQAVVFGHHDVKRCPKRKVLYMIFCIILTYWTCFIPFWLWQLLSVYHHHQLAKLNSPAVVCINFLVTCLAYSNSCINPFLYTLLSKNYKEYLRSQQKNSTLLSKVKAKRDSSRKSMLCGSQACTESMATAHLEGITLQGTQDSGIG